MLVLLDLGNVLYRIEFMRTIQALSSLPGYNGTPINFGVDLQDDVFMQFDRGQVTPPDFYQRLRDTFGLYASDTQIRNAWNAILVEPFPFALHVPQQLRSVHSSQSNLRIAILSNISEPHLEHCKKHLPLLTHPTLYGVDALYFSCAMGMRKPDPQIFLTVCGHENVMPNQAVLYDDSKANVESARGLGLRAVCVTPGDADLAFREPV